MYRWSLRLVKANCKISTACCWSLLCVGSSFYTTWSGDSDYTVFVFTAMKGNNKTNCTHNAWRPLSHHNPGILSPTAWMTGDPVWVNKLLVKNKQLDLHNRPSLPMRRLPVFDNYCYPHNVQFGRLCTSSSFTQCRRWHWTSTITFLHDSHTLRFPLRIAQYWTKVMSKIISISIHWF